jgi:hypothetical protein
MADPTMGKAVIDTPVGSPRLISDMPAGLSAGGKETERDCRPPPHRVVGGPIISLGPGVSWRCLGKTETLKTPRR